MDPLGFEPRAFRMQSERDTTTPRAHADYLLCFIDDRRAFDKGSQPKRGIRLQMVQQL